MTRDVAGEELLIDGLPERRPLRDEGVIQVVGHLAAAIVERHNRARSRAHRHREMFHPDRPAASQPGQLLHDVPQLADVARPAVANEGDTRVIGERQRLLRSLEKVLGQRPDILGPLPERRHVKVDDAQATQVFTKLAGRNEVGQVGGGDDTDVDARF